MSASVYRWRAAIVNSDLDATQKHVALTLSLHMDRSGGSCFPSLRTLAAETSRSKATVLRVLESIERAGLLKRQVPAGKGRGFVTQYTAVIPERVSLQNPSAAEKRVQRRPRKGFAAVPEDVSPRGHASAPAKGAPTKKKVCAECGTGAGLHVDDCPAAVSKVDTEECGHVVRCLECEICEARVTRRELAAAA